MLTGISVIIAQEPHGQILGGGVYLKLGRFLVGNEVGFWKATFNAIFASANASSIIICNPGCC